VKDFEAGAQLCEDLLHVGGLGHTCVIYSRDDAKIREFGLRMPAMRVLVNTPAPQGSTGITTNVFPSMTLGCGAMAGNVTSDNIGPLHLINLKRIAYHVRDAAAAFESPEGKAYFAVPAQAASGQGATPRPAIAEAVERYLASRGLQGVVSTPPAPAAARPAPQPVASVLANPADEVVERFLASRSQSPAASSPAPPAQTCPVPPPAPTPPAPPVEVVPFVSEADVRKAMRDGKKIFISSKTIVTPAARDMGADTLVKTD